MNKLYYNFQNFSTNFDDFFYKIDPTLTKNQRNFLSDIFTSILSANSINFDKLALQLSCKHHSIQFESILKRISRFLNNDNYNFHLLFDNLISYIFSSFKVKHDDNRVFLSFDHMFVKEKFTVFMLSIKIGRQGLPIYFNVYPGKHKPNYGDAFKINHIKKSLSYVHHLIKNIDPNIQIVWLADRWFGNLFPLFNFIHKTLNDNFVFRCKDNFKIYFFDKKEGHKIWTDIHHLPSYIHHSSFFENLEFTRKKYKYNLVL